jgi:hypothetical protein
MNISFAALIAAQVAALIAAVIALHSGGHDTATRDARKGKDDTT